MTTPTDTAKLADEIEALAKEATPGPWMLWRASDARPHELMSQHQYGGGMHRICEIHHYGWRDDVAKEVATAQLANGKLLEALVNSAPAIIAALRELDALKAENAKLREAVSHADRCERFVKLVAGQKLSEQAREWQEEEYGDDGDPDFEGAYDTFIEQARNIINDRRAALGGAG